MITVVQRVYEASVKVDGKVKGSIGSGLLVFFCVEDGDTYDKISYMSEKILNLRIFEDDNGKMSKSLHNVFTLEDLENNGFSAEDFRYFYFK